MPLSQRKDGLVLRLAGQADLPLLRLQEGRRRHQLHHGDREPDVPRGRAVSGQEGQPAGAGGRRTAGRRGPAAPPCAGAEPRRRPLVLRPAVLAGGRGGAGVSGQAADPEKHRRPLRHGRIPRPVGRPAHRHDPQGLHQGGAAGRRSGGQRQERPPVRQVPQPPDAAGHRHPRRRGGLRQPRHRQLRTQVHEYHRDHYI